MRLPPRIKTRLDARLQTRLSSAIQAVSRYFRRNEGTTDGYETSARLLVDPLTHFDVEFRLLGDVDPSGTFVAQNLGGNPSVREFQIYQINSPAFIILGGQSTGLATTLTAGLWRFIFDGVEVNLYNDGVLVETRVVTVGTFVDSAATFAIGVRHDGASSSYGFHYAGVIADVAIRNQAGTVVNNYPIDEQAGTSITDSVGGQDGVVINGIDDDRGLFTEQPTLWKGQNLIVPPWASVDQELLKA